MRKMRRPAAMLAVGALLAVPLSACGDDDDSSTDEGSTAATESTVAGGGAATIDVSETDFALSPANPTVAAGTVTINATNDGETTHSIEVEGPDGESELENELAPGESGELSVDLSKPGTYEWYCPVANHKDLGMKGEITVTG
jgi:uncharacterized cupredoxin-like copper-binding protein